MYLVTNRDDEKVCETIPTYEKNYNEYKDIILNMDYKLFEFQTRDGNEAIFYITPDRLTFKGCIGVIVDE
jgi:hypothetical protein